MSQLGHEIGAAIADTIAQAPDYIGSTLANMTWGEWTGVVLYVLGMRIFVEYSAEQRAQLRKLPRYMVRMTGGELVAAIFWPFIVAILAACDVIGRKENRDNVQAFVDEQLRREPADRHPWFQ